MAGQKRLTGPKSRGRLVAGLGFRMMFVLIYQGFLTWDPWVGFRIYEPAESLIRLGSAFCYGKESVLSSDSQRAWDLSKVKDHGSPLVGPQFAFPAKPGELLSRAILSHQPLLRAGM